MKLKFSTLKRIRDIFTRLNMSDLHHSTSNKISYFLLAVLLFLVPIRFVRASDLTLPADRGRPMMAYYTKGRIIYYDYTRSPGSQPAYSSILASNPVYARVHYQAPTMAYYAKSRVIYYDYTAFLPGRSFRVPDSGNFGPSIAQVAGSLQNAISLVRTENVGTATEQQTIKMRATPVANREAFEQEAEQTKGTPEENIVALQNVPVDAAGFYKRANAYKDTYDYTRAIQDYTEAIRLDPGNPYAYYKRGLCYTALSRMDLAIEDFRRANESMSGQDKPWGQKSRSWYPQNGY